jgi:hypothetical protein
MPNWVMNELTCIFQTKEELDAFKEKANTDGLFASFIPMPAVLENTVSPHIDPIVFVEKLNQRNGTNYLSVLGVTFSDNEWDVKMAKQILQNLKAFEETSYYNWYDWNCTKWGVKWDASECKVKNELPDFNTIIFSFNTPWGTPEQFVRELSKLYPNATFEMVSGSIENDNHYEFTCEDGKFEETCSYDSFRDAVEDGKWGGMEQWADLLEESEEV